MHYPSEKNDFQAAHAELLANSYRYLLHKRLIPPMENPFEFAQALFEAPFAVVSHGTETDPIFNYANRTALELFEMEWAEFTRTPSRLSAEPVNREERQRLLEQVSRNGFIDDYQGIRISKQGKRFLISNAIVWNLTNANGLYCGQAARFAEWRYL